uniref:RNA-directed DNA polymerase n=2 Tax=Caenorhabditis tropicalis TaxID=1561998 RepID=A0A1I7UWV7_9PELO
MDLPMDIDEILSGNEVRMEKDKKALDEMMNHFRKISKTSTKQCELMSKQFKDRMIEREIDCMKLTNCYMRQREIMSEMQKTIENLQEAVSQEANSIVNELRGRRSRADSERTNDTFAHPDQLQNSSNRRHQASLNSKTIRPIDEVEGMIRYIHEMEAEIKEKDYYFQQTKNQLVSSQRQNQEAMHNNRLLQLKLDAKMEELEKVKKELNEHSMNLHSNCFSRRGESQKQFDERNERNVQITVEQSQQAMPTRTQPPSPLREFSPCQNYQRERARNSEGDEYSIRNMSHDSFQEHGNPIKIYPNKEDSDMSLFNRMLLEQNLPEPAKFSAESKSVSISAFEKTFSMKYGRLTESQQIVLLETKFLVGKALQVYNGLASHEKHSVKDIMRAMSERLRVSIEDETRRAKNQWDSIRIQEHQTMDDFCLRLDEVARVAFRRVQPVELSSIKTAKVLKAAAIRSETMRCMMDNKLADTPEINHYDACRVIAIRYETALKDSQAEKLQNSKYSSYSERKVNRMQSVTPNQVQSSSNVLKSTRQSENEHVEEESKKTWRSKQKPESSQAPASSATCSECQQIGCHEPSCSKAPRYQPRSMASVQCYDCKEMGHYATKCPKRETNKAKSSEQVQKSDTAPQQKNSVQTIEEKCLEMGKMNSRRETSIRDNSERGQVGISDVEVILDSGSCISLISYRTWEKILKENGKDWSRRMTAVDTEGKSVLVANCATMHLKKCVTVPISIREKTSKVLLYLADVDRDSIILGIGYFEALGIQMKFVEEGRNVKVTKAISLRPGERKLVEVCVEGVLPKEVGCCLINPCIDVVATAICHINLTGKAVIQMCNFGEDAVFLSKNQKVGTGELTNFQVLNETMEPDKLQELIQKMSLEEKFQESESIGIGEVMNIEDARKRFHTVCEHLNRDPSDGLDKVWNIVEKFQDVFALDDNELGRTNLLECEIELNDGAEPIRQKPRPIPLAVRPQIREMLQKMVSQDVIRESRSPWSSPVVLVKKKDGSVRMCIDYRKVNKVVRNNAHPLPNIESTLQSLSGKRVFTTLDLLAGYWQIPLQEDSKPITAFAIGSELYEWNVLPFGLVTSPAVFQATMESVVGESLGQCAFVYVDDLLIASESIDQHVLDLENILIRIRKSGMKLRAKKCRIAQKEVEYLGHNITPEGVKTQETKVEKMKKFSRPTNSKELQSFLGLVNYYRKFIMNFAKMASSLTPLTSPRVPWKWETEQEESFQNLIKSICEAPVLMQPDVEAAIDGSRPFMIYTDASHQGVGAVLAQEGEDGEQHPIAFMSKSLSPAEKKYHITDLEALAMMSALRRFKTIIYGTPVIVFTDHKPLISLLKGTPQVNNRFFWPRMRVTIEKVVRGCPKCVSMNSRPKLVAPLNPYNPSFPLEIVACDLVDVGLSIQGNRYMLTIIDLFTKYGTAVPIPDKRAETVLKAFTERWAIGEGRIPEKLLTDQGKEFDNELFSHFTKLMNIEHVMTKGYNSRANGCVERFNQTIEGIIKKKSPMPMEWDDQVAFAVYAYNSIVHKTTGETPMFLMYGRDSKVPLQKEGNGAGGICYAEVDEYKHLLTNALEKAHQLAREQAAQEYEEHKKFFDEKHKTSCRKYPQPGSRVLVEIPSEKLGARCPKLVNKWKGPYRVISVTKNSATVAPIIGDSKKILEIPFDNLRIVPPEMENVPIETKKGRKGKRNVTDGDSLQEIQEINNVFNNVFHNDDLFFRELMHCRCPGTRCTFVAQSNPSIKSFSPTQWIRMKRLLSKYPILKDQPKVVKFLTQGNTLSKLNVPIETGPPTKDEFLELANCQTMFLMVEDMPDWKIAFDNSTAQILEEIVGKELLNPKKPLTLVAPGCHQEDVPLNNSNMLQFDNWKTAIATLQNVLQNNFNEVMNGKPEGTGKWDMLSPSTPVIEENGRALVLLREVLSAEETWKMIYEKLKERGFQWPGFRIKGPEPIQEIRRHEFSGKENGKSTEPRGKHPASRSRASSVAPIPKRRHQY